MPPAAARAAANRQAALLHAPCAAGEWQAWETPSIKAAWPLEWCDRVSQADGNHGFTLLPQHPCAFLRNATAAALAAGAAEAA